jgi:hypothetical protein
MPAGALATEPGPVPARVTVSGCGLPVNVAVTARACVIVTVQVPVPEHAPVQPVNVVFAPGVAVNVTLVL